MDCYTNLFRQLGCLEYIASFLLCQASEYCKIGCSNLDGTCNRLVWVKNRMTNLLFRQSQHLMASHWISNPDSPSLRSLFLHCNFLHFTANDTNLHQNVYVNEVSFCFALLMTCIAQKSLLFDDWFASAAIVYKSNTKKLSITRDWPGVKFFASWLAAT
jgi:hypothetical protein